MAVNWGMAVRRGQRRDFQALEQRRKQAARLFARGTEALASIARQLKVSRQSVSRWHHEWEQNGARALNAAGRAGRKPRLTARQLRRVEAALKKGAGFHGFSADLWTLPRVATVIERITGVRYHPGHVWKILGAMDWSSQKPVQQARERNQEQVECWKTVRWPEVKKTLLGNVHGSSSKTNPASPNSRPSAGRGRRADERQY
jgi:transposase